MTNSEFTRQLNEYTAGLFVQRYWRLGGQLHLFIQGGSAFTIATSRTRVNVTKTQPGATTQYSWNSPGGYPIGMGYGSPPPVGTSPIETFVSRNKSTYATRQLAFNLSPGLVYLATQRLGLTLMLGEAALQFKSTSSMGPSGEGLKLDTYGLDMGMNTLQLGFQFHL
jgi:hypothetical protein